MKETTKANSLRRRNDPLFTDRVFVGDGLDIGPGNDPLVPSGMFPLLETVRTFDLKNGDANYMSLDEVFDFVYSSNCLEHMVHPAYALKKWWEHVKVNGYLVVVVPDEELYEHNIFPSNGNPDHKHTFSLHDGNTEFTQNIFNLIYHLEDAKIIKVQLVDTNYDYSLGPTVDQTRRGAEAFIEFVLQKK